MIKKETMYVEVEKKVPFPKEELTREMYDKAVQQAVDTNYIKLINLAGDDDDDDDEMMYCYLENDKEDEDDIEDCDLVKQANRSAEEEMHEVD